MACACGAFAALSPVRLKGLMTALPPSESTGMADPIATPAALKPTTSPGRISLQEASYLSSAQQGGLRLQLQLIIPQAATSAP
jgi:hypothetical protein